MDKAGLRSLALMRFMCACSINYWRYPCRGLRRLLDIAAVVAGDCFFIYEARRTRTLASHARHHCYFPSANSRVAGSTYQLFLLKTCSLLATAWSVTRQRPLDAQASPVLSRLPAATWPCSPQSSHVTLARANFPRFRNGKSPVFATAGDRRCSRRPHGANCRRSMHVLGNIANLILYFSSPPSFMTNFPAAAACVAASVMAALCTSRFMNDKT